MDPSHDRPQPGEAKPIKDQRIWTREFVLVALTNLAAFIGFNMTTTGMPVYVATLGGSDFAVGLVTTLATGAALLVRPFAGIMLDRFGRKGILIVGGLIMAITTASYAVFPVVGFILALRAVQGIGWGLGSTATSTIAADAIPRGRFAEGMGYFALTSSVAVAIAPALSVFLVQSAGALPMIVLASVASLLVVALACAQKLPKAVGRAGGKRLGASDFFDKRALLPAGAMFLINVAFASVTTFIVLFGQERGVDDVFLYFIVYALVTILTRPIIGKLIDRVGFFVPGLVSTAGVAATMIVISLSDTVVMFCIAGVFAGLGIGAGMGTLQAMAVAAVPSGRRGVATSTFLFGVDAGIAVGALIAGGFAGLLGYAGMYSAMAVFPAAAFLLFAIVGRKRISRYSSDDR